MFYNDFYCFIFVLGIAFILSLVLTPIFRDAAGRVGLVDSPDGRRKHQKRPIPRAGGLAVFIAAVGAIFSLSLFGFDFTALLREEPRMRSLFLASFVIVVVGLADDFVGLRGRHKLLGQLVATSLLIYYDHLVINQLSIFGFHLDLGVFGIVLTYAWMIGIINAINLIDGMDGLLGVIGILVCVSLAVVAAISGNDYVAVVALALTGALTGFLFFNLPPASVYLGDCGSMLVGLVVGALSIQGMVKGPTAMALAIPISILILPILDTTAAITRRKLTGRSIYTTDRGHLHHCLLRTGMNRPVVLGLILVLGLVASAGGIAATLLHNDLYSFAAMGIVVISLVAGRLFGHAELALMIGKLRATAALMWNGKRAGRSHQVTVHLQGSVRWETIWDELTVAAFRCNFKSLSLDVNAPALHEGYHARWERFGAGGSHEALTEWSAQLPVTLGGTVIGHLTAVGLSDAEPMWIKLQQLGEIVRSTEQNIHRLTEQLSVSTVSTVPTFSEPVVVTG